MAPYSSLTGGWSPKGAAVTVNPIALATWLLPRELVRQRRRRDPIVLERG